MTTMRIAGTGLAVVLVCGVGLAAQQSAGPAPKTPAKPQANVYLTIKDVNKADAYGMTALHRAVEAGDQAAIDRLIRAGADVNALNRYHVAPISIAAGHGDAAAVQRLLAGGADANVVMGEGEPVIMTAARSGNVEAVKALLVAGADVNARERLYGQTAVMWAAIDNHPDVIKALAEKGADLDTGANLLPGTPTWREGADNRTGIHGETLQNLNTNFSKGGLTALTYAARQGSTEAAKMLVDLGAKPGYKDGEGYTPLLLAIMNAHYDTAAALIEKGADVNQTDNTGQPPLFALVDQRSLLWTYNRPGPRTKNQMDSLELAKVLIAKGAKVDAALNGPARRPLGGGGSAMTAKGATAFLRAALVSDLPMMKLLIDKGADPWVTTPNGANAFMIAAGLGWNENTMRTATGIGFATEEDTLEALKLLLPYGFDVNATDSLGRTAMHGAAVRGANQVIKYLVDQGGRLDIRSKDGRAGFNVSDGIATTAAKGRTPLDEAMLSDPQRPQTVRMLRTMLGMDPNAPIPAFVPEEGQ